MKFKKVLATAVSAVLIATTFPSSCLFSEGNIQAASSAVTQIPNTTRSFSNYSDSFMNLTGFAKDGVNDRAKYVGTSYQVKVSTEKAFLQALKDAQDGKVKLIELTSDMNLGFYELGLSTSEASQYGISKYEDPTNGYTNPVLKTNGVSKLNISNTNGLTIYSLNGSTMRHVELKLQGSTSDLAIRNINFEGLYQFDDVGNHKEVGWTFIKVNGANDVWIDHCSFGVAQDGMLDVENGSSGLTLSWCKFGREANSAPSTNSAIYQSVNYMENQYKKGALTSTSRYYKLRKAGASVSQIMAYEAYHSKTHLVGSGDKDYCNYVGSNGNTVLDGNQRLEITMAYNHYLNEGQRQPMIRQGKGHLFNCYFDNSSHMSLHNSVSALKSNGQYSLSRAINARNGASIGADTCVYKYVASPIIGTERQGDDTGNMKETFGKLFANAYNHSLIVNSKVINSDGSTYTGSSWDNNGSNAFTKDFVWNNKSTIGKWAWSSSINGVENMSKTNPPSTPFSFTYHYNEKLPYSYQVLPLDKVQTVIPSKAGCGKVTLDAKGWATTSYGSTVSVSPSPSPSASGNTNTPANIEEGTYMIKNVNSNLYLDVANGTAENSTNVQQWGASTPSNWDTWRIVKYGNYYKIYSLVGDGKTYVLDVAAKSTDDKANIQIYKDNSGDNQLFQFVKNQDGSYGVLTKITNFTSGLDVAANSTSSGANIQQYHYNATANQSFKLEKVNTETSSPLPVPTQSPTPKPSQNAPVSPSPSNVPSSSTGVIDISGTSSTWDGGYNLELAIKNISQSTISDWKLYLNSSQVSINSMWCASYTTSGPNIIITPESWNKTVATNGSVSFGFTANGNVPTSVNYIFVYTSNGTEHTYSSNDKL